jgi:TonB family protein
MNAKLRLVSFAFCLVLGLSAARAQKVEPKLIEAPSPGYPEELTDTGLSGAAEVDITVKADGTVADAQLAMANHRAFGRAAMVAVTAWRFEPGTRDGTPVDMRVTVPFRFAAPFEQQINAAAKRKVFIPLPEPALTAKDYGAKLKVKKPARPVYPRALAGSDAEEKIQVSFVIAPDGTTLNPAIVGTPAHKEFLSPAIQAVAGMTYEPLQKDGKGVYVETTTTVAFSDERANRGDSGGSGGGRGGKGGGGGGRGGGGGGG